MNIIYCHHANRNKSKMPSNADDITPIGEQDAQIVAELLKMAKDSGVMVAGIYTSNFYRCVRTAHLINKHIDAPIMEEARLNEFGSVEGESWLDAQLRVKEVILELIEKHKDSDTVICVTSGVNIAPFICLNFGIDIDENTPFVRVPSCSPIMFEFPKSKFIGFNSKAE